MPKAATAKTRAAKNKPAGNTRSARPARARTAAEQSEAKAGSAPGDEAQLRRAIIETALDMSLSGLSPGRSGNVSARWSEGMLITPSGMAYDTIGVEDVVYVADDGTAPGDQRKPSSEWRIHLAAYHKRPDCAAVVHTHSLHATVLACAHKPIPAFHYMVAVAGGTDIPLVPYALFGTTDLAGHVASGLADRNACLMANHGQIAIGNSLDAALELANEIETLAEQYVKLLTLGKPKLLTKAQMAEVLERIKSYGQNAQGSEGD